MSKKTLVVSYLPSGEASSTKKVLDHFVKSAGGTVTHLDLEEKHPPVFTKKSLAAYRARNYGGQVLDADQAKDIKPFDDLVSQLKAADVLVLAFPMHNFSLPGVVKSYLDAVMFHGETFQYGPTGPEGLLKDKTALVISATGGMYPSGAPMNNIDTLAKIELNFMGFGTQEYVYAGAQLAGPEAAAQNLTEAQTKVSELAKNWYN